MYSFGPMGGLHVCIMGAKAAEQHCRRAYNIPPDVGIGWTPYRIIVTNRALPHTAFVRMSEFKRWLRSRTGFTLKLAPRFAGESRGYRIGTIREE